MDKETAKERLEYLRKQIDDECISYGEIAELQALAEHIDESDIQLLEWVGVPENECDHVMVRDDYGAEYCQECGTYKNI